MEQRNQDAFVTSFVVGIVRYRFGTCDLRSEVDLFGNLFVGVSPGPKILNEMHNLTFILGKN